MPTIRGETSERLVEEILNGKLFASNVELEAVKRYEYRWRNTYFSKIKTTDLDPDLRSIWEPARLQHIAILINYIIQNKKTEFIDRVLRFTKNNVLKWINDNPFPYGLHYISAMECGLRIPLLFYTLKVLDNLKASEIQLIFDTLYRHAWLVSNSLSLYSSRGNHTIAEATGLVFGGAVFRNTAEGRRWLLEGCEILKRELDLQILDDGGPAEQSLNYHRFVLDLYWLATDFLDKNNLYDCSDFGDHLIKAEQFIAAFEDANGSLPLIGDSDDGQAIAPGVYPRRNYPNNKKQKVQTFFKSGYTIVNDKNVVLTFDHGPLGMAPLYNHGHADALSITLSVDGQKILVDPGTYRYNGEPEFRKYFKGTRAHNTITIDGQDQATQKTGFIWSHPYNVELLGFSENADHFLVTAIHDGYKRLEKPVQHKREILFFGDRCFLIKDSFVGKGFHDFEINFHLHPDALVIKKNSWWQTKNEGAHIYMRLLENCDFSIIRGLKDPIHGWYSPAYGKKLKSNVMSCQKNGFPHEICFLTAICTEDIIDMKNIQDMLIYFD